MASSYYKDFRILHKWNNIVSKSLECRNQGFKNKIYNVLWSTTTSDILNMHYYGPCALLLLVQWDDKKVETQMWYMFTIKTVSLYVQIGSGKSQRWLWPPCIIQLEAGVTLYICSRNAGDLSFPCQCCVSQDVRGDVTSNGFHLTYQRRFVFSYGTVRTPELSGSTWFTGGPKMYYVMCRHSDEALWTWSHTQQTWLAPALLWASWVAFGNAFTHPVPQFFPLEKTGIVFLSPKGLGG